MTYRKYLEAAVQIAKEAGVLQLDGLHKAKQIEFKGSKMNVVTQVDKACEKHIVDFLRGEFPEHDLLAEEGSRHQTHSDWLWIIDPLDGTLNYSHGYPLFATSIGLMYKKELVVGVVYEPNRDELFVAEKGGGALLNEKPIRVSDKTDMKLSMMSTGFAYNVNDTDLNNMDHFSNFIATSQAVRRDGVASTNLCYVACGRFDGFWEMFLYPWDMAAGVLIIQEAGGEVTLFDGSPIDIFKNEIVASNGHLHRQMIEVLKKGNSP